MPRAVPSIHPLIFVLWLTTPAQAYTGNELLKICANSGSDVARGLCAGYISGAAEAFRTCPFPEGASKEQLLNIGYRYLQATPQRLHEPAVWLIRDAIERAWPCLR